MRRLAILSKTLRDLRYQVLGYGVGLALIAMLDVYIYPSYQSQLAKLELPEALKALVGNADYASPQGFLSAEFYSWAPILLVVFAVMAGTSALAGEEADGTLDLLLAQPLSRARLALEKLGGLAICSLGIAAVIYAGWLLSVPFVTIDISYGRLTLATLAMVPLTLAFATMAMFASVLLPGRGLATATVGGLAMFSFFTNYLASLVDVLKPLRFVSLFFYFDGGDVLSSGISVAKIGVLIGVSLVFAWLTVVTFEARDLGTRGGITWPHLRPVHRSSS